MTLSVNIQQEPVRNLPLRKALSVTALASVREAILLMQQHQLGCVFVVDAHGHPLGVFHERILLSMLDESPDAIDGNVARFLDKRCAYVRLDEPISSVLWAIQSHDQRFVGVVDEAGKLVNLTGEKGLMEYVADHFPRQVMVAVPGSQIQSTMREGA